MTNDSLNAETELTAKRNDRAKAERLAVLETALKLAHRILATEGPYANGRARQVLAEVMQWPT